MRTSFTVDVLGDAKLYAKVDGDSFNNIADDFQVFLECFSFRHPLFLSLYHPAIVLFALLLLYLCSIYISSLIIYIHIYIYIDNICIVILLIYYSNYKVCFKETIGKNQNRLILVKVQLFKLNCNRKRKLQNYVTNFFFLIIYTHI